MTRVVINSVKTIFFLLFTELQEVDANVENDGNPPNKGAWSLLVGGLSPGESRRGLVF